jgi:ribosomal protein S18 acetylase RimI-like enzyme
MPASEIAGFVAQSLFKNDGILVYGRDLRAGFRIQSRPESAQLIAKGEVADLAACRSGEPPIPWECKCDVFDGVTDFFVHRDGGRIGHISWLYYKDHPNRLLRLSEGECEIKFCLTFPTFRGRGLYPAALSAIQAYLTQQGYQRCFICVKEDNIPSIRGIEKAGFHRLGSLRMLKAFGLQISRPRRTSDFQVPASR